jgi:hypothetical protein
MEQIPTEVTEKIKLRFPVELAWNVMDTSSIQRKAAEYGYRLASPCALCEGKEKEIAELKKEVDKNYGFIWKAFRLSVCDLPQEEQDKYWLEFLTENNL